MNFKSWIWRHCSRVGQSVSLAAMSMMLWLVSPAAWAATATSTQLQTNGATAAWGTPVQFTARVMSGTSPVTAGHVFFCNGAAATIQACQGQALLAQGQLTSNGTSAVNLRLGVGTHSVKTFYQGTTQYSTSMSNATTVTVTGSYATATNLTASGSAGNYALKATVNALGSNAVAGTVDFNLTTGTMGALGSAVLGTATPISGRRSGQRAEPNEKSKATERHEGCTRALEQDKKQACESNSPRLALQIIRWASIDRRVLFEHVVLHQQCFLLLISFGIAVWHYTGHSVVEFTRS